MNEWHSAASNDTVLDKLCSQHGTARMVDEIYSTEMTQCCYEWHSAASNDTVLLSRTQTEMTGSRSTSKSRQRKITNRWSGGPPTVPGPHLTKFCFPMIESAGT